MTVAPVVADLRVCQLAPSGQRLFAFFMIIYNALPGVLADTEACQYGWAFRNFVLQLQITPYCNAQNAVSQSVALYAPLACKRAFFRGKKVKK